MTLNQVINRIKEISLSHQQVRAFKAGLPTDFFTEKTSLYPAVLLQDNGGTISLSGHATTLNYRLYFLDLVNVSSDSKTNEQDVQSDMVSVAEDILAQMNFGEYTDWRISGDNNLQLVVEQDNDLIAGVIVDISIRIIYEQNVCAIPSDLIFSPTDNEDMKTVYDYVYTANGTEGKTLTIPQIDGKKILLLTRDNNVLFKVSNNPESIEYSVNGSSVTVGINTISGQRFLFLYRNL